MPLHAGAEWLTWGIGCPRVPKHADNLSTSAWCFPPTSFEHGRSAHVNTHYFLPVDDARVTELVNYSLQQFLLEGYVQSIFISVADRHLARVIQE